MPKVPKSRLTLSGEIREQRRRITDKTTQFSGTGLHFPEPGTVQVEGNLWVTGDFTADGKISNDALVNPVVPKVAHASADNFIVPTVANAVRATATITVPDGFTTALVTATAGISAYNDTASADFLYVAAWIQADTDIGWSLPVTVPAGESGVTSQTATALLTSLGASFTVKAACSSVNGSWNTGLTGGTYINVDATVLFLR